MLYLKGRRRGRLTGGLEGWMATTERAMTADNLWQLPRDGRRRRLVAGRLEEMAPAGDDHGRYAGVFAAVAG
jgi:hypothetical protein